MIEFPCNVMVTRPTNWTAVTIPLAKWMQIGPGLRLGRTFDEVFCEDDGRKLPRSVVPIPYRDDYLSQFLIAMGVFEYPWQEDYDMVVELYGERFEPIESINPLPLQTENPTQPTHQTFVIDSDLKLALSSNWQCIRVKSFHVSFQIFANNDIFEKDNSDFQLQSFSSDKNFLFCTIVTFRKHPLSLDDYVPDKNHGEELSHGGKEAHTSTIEFAAHSILGKNLALISVIKELPFEADKNNIFHTGKNHQYIHLIGLSNIGGYEDAMQQMIDCALSVKDST